MRMRRLGAGAGAAHLREQYGLAAGPRRVERGEKRAAVAYPLGVGRDDPDLRAGRHPLDALGYRHVALVAGGHPEPHADAPPPREQPEMRSVRAALARDGDRAGPRAVKVEGGGEGREEPDRGVVDAEAVRAQDAHPALARDPAHPPLACRALRAGLGEARGEHHGRPHPPFGACLDGVEGQAGRDRHDGDVDLAGHLFDGGARLDPLDPIAAWIDRPDRALEPERPEVAQRPAADAGRVVRRADDRDGAGVEESVEPGARHRLVSRRWRLRRRLRRSRRSCIPGPPGSHARSRETSPRFRASSISSTTALVIGSIGSPFSHTRPTCWEIVGSSSRSSRAFPMPPMLSMK